MKKWTYKLGLVVLLVSIPLTARTPAVTQEFSVLVSNAQTQPPAVVSTSTIPSILLRIGGCESNGGPDLPPRQFYPDGYLVWGKNPTTGKEEHKDLGMYQIHLATWETTAKERGDDLYTPKGNQDFALWLYQQYGTSPWKPSKHCWKTL